MENFKETKYLVLRILRENVLLVIYKDFVKRVDLEIAKEIWAARMEFQGGRRCFLIIQEPGAIEFTWDALVFLGSEQGVEGLIAIAMVISNFKSLATGAFLKDVQEPLVPTNIVDTQGEALAWFESLNIEIPDL